MSVVLLPILREALEAETHRAGRQIGKLLALAQDDEATILRQQMQPSLPLFLGPLDRLVAGLEVEGRRAPAQEGPPSALGVDGDVAELFADQGRVLEVMMFGNQSVPPFGVPGRNQFHPQLVQDALLVWTR